MMEAAKRGGDRQELHERIRIHSMEAAKQVKLFGNANDLIERIAGDAAFGMSFDEIMSVMEAKNYIGRAPQQVEEFVKEHVMPALSDIQTSDIHAELKV